MSIHYVNFVYVKELKNFNIFMADKIKILKKLEIN